MTKQKCYSRSYDRISTVVAMDTARWVDVFLSDSMKPTLAIDGMDILESRGQAMVQKSAKSRNKHYSKIMGNFDHHDHQVGRATEWVPPPISNSDTRLICLHQPVHLLSNCFAIRRGLYLRILCRTILRLLDLVKAKPHSVSHFRLRWIKELICSQLAPRTISLRHIRVSDSKIASLDTHAFGVSVIFRSPSGPDIFSPDTTIKTGAAHISVIPHWLPVSNAIDNATRHTNPRCRRVFSSGNI